MKRILSNTILATSIFGMTTVPVFSAVGHTPHHIAKRGSVSAFHNEIFGGMHLHLAQSVNEPVGGESTDPTGDDGETGGESGEPESEVGDDFGGESEMPSYDRDSSESDQRFETAASSGNAERIVQAIGEGEAECKLLDTANQIACLAEVYRATARGLSSEGDAGNVKRALQDAARKLEKIVDDNVDTTVAPVRLTRQTRDINRSSRPLSAIKPASIPAAKQQAAAVVTELSTVLLRSASNASERNTYYAKIAKAVDSNKVLLRS